MMNKGYTGKILKINLTTGKSTIETQDSAFYRRSKARKQRYVARL